MAIIEVIDPPGELMYIVISRSGSIASSVSSWAITSLAEASSIWTPRKMIRSSKSLLYGFISLTPYDVRSTKDGSTYLDCGVLLFRSVTFVRSLTDSGHYVRGFRSRACGASGADAPGRDLERAVHNVIDEAVALGLLGGEPAVPVGVLLDGADGLAGVRRRPPEQRLLDVQHLLGLDPDVGRGTADAAGRLVHQHRGVRQRVSLALGAGREQELAHRGGHPHRVGAHVVGHELHHVVDRQTRVDRTARGVDVERDVARRVLGGEQKHLGADPVGDVVVHLLPEKDNAVPQQPLEQQIPRNHGGVRGSRPGN